MKYLKYTLLFTIVIGSISFIGIYLINHGKMQMDRIFAYSDDASTLFIGEMTRQQVFGFIFIHSYEFNIYSNGVNKNEHISFYSLSKDIEPNSQLKLFIENHNYETTASQFSFLYELSSGSTISIATEELNASFVTKTDPNYFRYMSNGSGTILINGEKKNSHILSDTKISWDSSYAYLRKGTQVNGYMGGAWGSEGSTDYFDISQMIQKGEGETYQDHSYILSLDGNRRSKKEYGIEVDEKDNKFFVLQNNIIKLAIDTKNIIKIGQGIKHDTYYYFTGKRGDGTPIGGFLNFVK